MLSVKKIVAAVFLSAVVFFSTPAFAAQYTIGISISGLETIDLSTFNIDITYKTEVLSVLDYTLTTELGSFEEGSLDGEYAEAEDWSDGDDMLGTLNLCVFSYLDDFSFQSDSFLLTTITFEASDDAKMSDISIAYRDLGDGDGEPFDCTINGTGITVSATPIPSALSLMTLGLMSLIGFVRKNSK